MKVVALIQARMGSSRLPGKVLLPLGKETILSHMLLRLQTCRHLNKVAVITTKEEQDNVLERTCLSLGIDCFRGHSTDLLDRHFQAAKKMEATIILKIPSDCPLIDPRIVDQTLEYYFSQNDKLDFVSNLHPPTYPDGNDVEIITMSALEKAWKEAKHLYEREHTTPYIWDNPDVFQIANLQQPQDQSKKYRWTLDYWEDYKLIQCVYEALYPIDPVFGCNQIISFLEKNRTLQKLNQKHLGDGWYVRQEHQLKTGNY